MKPTKNPKSFERVTADYYDQRGKDYSRIWNEQIHTGLFRAGNEQLDEAVKVMTDYLANLVDIKKSVKVLSVGCGRGSADKQLQASYGVSIYGIDISENQLREVRRNCPEGSYYNSSMQTIPFEDNYFDIVWVQQSLFHSHDKPAAVREFYRVVKPGGKVVVEDSVLLNPAYREEVLESFGKRVHLTSINTVQELLRYFAEVGFGLVHLEDVSRHLGLTYQKVIEKIRREGLEDLHLGFVKSHELVLDRKLGSSIFVLEKPSKEITPQKRP